MKTVLFLLLIYAINTHANDTDEEGCTISFFKKEAPCSSIIDKKEVTIAASAIKNTPKKKVLSSKQMEVNLRKILNNVTQYKNKNETEKQKLLLELNAMKKELNTVKKQLNTSNKKVKETKLIKELNSMKKEFNQYKAKEHTKIKEIKKQLYLSNKKVDYTKKILVKAQKKLNQKTIIVEEIQQVTQQKTPIVHKVIRKMIPLPIVMYETPWIEIIVEHNIDIYELALKYYGNKQAYKKIYLANKNIISNDFQIYNGMSLIIPMTETFEEQPIMLNSY